MKITKEFLDTIYARYHKAGTIEGPKGDPVQFLHQFKDKRDIEIVGLIAALFAYGRVEKIIENISGILKATDNKPYKFASTYTLARGEKLFKDFYYRFNKKEEIIFLFYLLNRIYKEHDSMEDFFTGGGETVYDILIRLHDNILAHFPVCGVKNTCGFKFLFTTPETGSACKRMNLFLKWMVRKDGIDRGIWTKLRPSDLVIPLDTHIYNFSRKNGIITRKAADWKTAMEITEFLRKMDPADPVKYDLSICRYMMAGMLKIK